MADVKSAVCKIPLDFERDTSDNEYYGMLFMASYAGYQAEAAQWSNNSTLRALVIRSGINRILASKGLNQHIVATIYDMIPQVRVGTIIEKGTRQTEIYAVPFENPEGIKDYWKFSQKIEEWYLVLSITPAIGNEEPDYKIMVGHPKMLSELIISREKYAARRNRPEKLYRKLAKYYAGFSLEHVQIACELLSEICDFSEKVIENTFRMPVDVTQIWLRKIEEIQDYLEVGMNSENPRFQELAYNQMFAELVKGMMLERQIPEMDDIYVSLNVIIEPADLDYSARTTPSKGNTQRPTLIWELTRSVLESDWHKAAKVLGCLPIDYSYVNPYLKHKGSKRRNTNCFFIRTQYKSYLPLIWRIGVQVILEMGREDGLSWKAICDKLISFYHLMDSRVDVQPERRIERMLDLMMLFLKRKGSSIH